MNRLTPIALLAVSVALAACSATSPGATPSPVQTNPPSATPAPATPAPVTPAPGTPAPAGLDGRQFVVVTLSDRQLVPGTKIRLTFANGQVSASAGCNTMSGSYQLDGGTLKVGSLATTEIGCQPALANQDQWLATFLGSGPKFVLSGNDLTLTAGSTVITLLDREVAEPDQPLVGVTWTLTSIISGDTVSSVPVGVMATLLFKDDGTVEAQYGCNSGGGKYAVDGDQLRFSEMVTTDMACVGAGGQVEAAVMAVINAESVTYAIDSASLTLLAGDNGLQYSAALDV